MVEQSGEQKLGKDPLDRAKRVAGNIASLFRRKPKDADPALKRQAAYLRKVLPPVTKGAFDVNTGESYLEPPEDVVDRDPTEMAKLAETAVSNGELEQKAIIDSSLYWGIDHGSLRNGEP
jgi:hypothetical protein